jgi:hypothetical protein
VKPQILQLFLDHFKSFISHRLNHPVKRFKPSEARPPDPMRPSPYNRRSSTNDLYSYHLQQQNVASSPNNLSQPFIKQEVKQEAGCSMSVSCICTTRHVVWSVLRVWTCAGRPGINHCPWHFHITLVLLCRHNLLGILGWLVNFCSTVIWILLVLLTFA